MKNKHQNNKVDAFTILEVTVVIAIMSVLVTIIATATNRFGEQLKNNSEISQELNNWNAFRSNLWREFYTADSIKTEENKLFVFNEERIIEYKLENELIKRTDNNVTINTGISASSIMTEKREHASLIAIDFIWKGEIMALKFYSKPELSDQINSYFEKL